jgi:hypothetical protein
MNKSTIKAIVISVAAAAVVVYAANNIDAVDDLIG